MDVCVYMCLYVCVWCMCVCVCMCICVYVFMCESICVFVCIYVVKIELEDTAVFILWKLWKYKTIGLSLFLLALQALLHNEFLGQNFCPEHNTEEVSRCHNYVM